MKKFKEFREGIAADEEELRMKASRKAKRAENMSRQTEEAIPIANTKKAKATANHPAEDGIEGDVTHPTQGGSEQPKLTHMCAMKVSHPKFGEGKPMMGEHAEPDASGKVWWYKVMFEHGIETCETYALEVLEESSHSNHTKKKY